MVVISVEQFPNGTKKKTTKKQKQWLLVMVELGVHVQVRDRDISIFHQSMTQRHNLVLLSSRFALFLLLLLLLLPCIMGSPVDPALVITEINM